MYSAKYLAISLIALFAPIGPVLTTVLILILSDLCFGMWAAKVRGEILTSAAMRRTVSKFFVYETVLCVAYLGETYLLSSMVPVTRLVAGVIGLVEMTSVLENVQAATGLDLTRVIHLLGSKNDTKTGQPPEDEKK